MESPNALWVEYLLQLKKDAEEKGSKFNKNYTTTHFYGLINLLLLIIY